MKSFSKIFGLAALTLTAALTSCEGEKDLIIIEEDLPIKTSTLYMVGDATPNGWSIDAPTALTPSEEDPLIFTYEGVLNPGEMKLCLTPGSWDAPFIRPAEAGLEVTKAGRPAETFVMHAGDPDLKWRIADKEYTNSFSTFATGQPSSSMWVKCQKSLKHRLRPKFSTWWAMLHLMDGTLMHPHSSIKKANTFSPLKAI